MIYFSSHLFVWVWLIVWLFSHPIRLLRSRHHFSCSKACICSCSNEVARCGAFGSCFPFWVLISHPLSYGLFLSWVDFLVFLWLAFFFPGLSLNSKSILQFSLSLGARTNRLGRLICMTFYFWFNYKSLSTFTNLYTTIFLLQNYLTNTDCENFWRHFKSWIQN